MSAEERTQAQATPPLRPTLTSVREREVWAHPCPTWCIRDEGTHEPDWIVSGPREHRSVSLRVRQDAGRGYYDRAEGSEVAHIRAAHIELYLRAGSRHVAEPTISVSANWGNADGERRTFRLAALYLDEAEELVVVLRHLLARASTAIESR